MSDKTLDGWARLQVFGSALPTEREHNSESSPVRAAFFFSSQVPGILCKSGSSYLVSSQCAAAWLAGGQMEALFRASPCRRRGTQPWHGAPRAPWQIGQSWESPHFACRPSVDCQCARRLFAPTSLREAFVLSTIFFLRLARRSRDQGGGFPPMSIQLPGMGASRRSSIHLGSSQAEKARGLQAPTADTGLACAKRLLGSHQSLWSASHQFRCTLHWPLRRFMRELGTMLQRLW